MDNFISTFSQQAITFFAIMDPIGISAMSLAILSSNITNTQINKVAFRATTTIVIAFFVVMFTGEFILNLFGININALKVMGGLVLLLMAISMLNGTDKPKAFEDNKLNEELAIIPIAIPIAFGTGLFSAIIIYKHDAKNFLDLFSITLAYCINALIFYLIFKNSIYIKKLLGVTGQNIITKLMGLITGAFAIQFIISGIITLSKIYLKQ